MNTKFQLALQFPGCSPTDYDAMIALEAALTTALGENAEVDGHDVGSEAMSLFIFTDNPHATFAEATPLLEQHDKLEWVTAAYREVNSDRYTVIWPPGWRKEFKLD